MDANGSKLSGEGMRTIQIADVQVIFEKKKKKPTEVILKTRNKAAKIFDARKMSRKQKQWQ